MSGHRGCAPRPVCRLAVVGRQDSGKTTWIERILGRWAAAGVRAAVIKHDGHAAGPGATVLGRWQKPGSDTDRELHAGAAAAAVVGGGATMWLLPADASAGSPDELALRMMRLAEAADAPLDAVLLEGGKASAWPKLAVVRRPEDLAWLTDELGAGRIRGVWGVACSGGLDKVHAGHCLAGRVTRVYDELDLAELCDELLADPELRWQTGEWDA
jgi:molybdopterin-guanine dinucleotide biosynthesis protein MobB